jgi:hypothetical protein
MHLHVSVLGDHLQGAYCYRVHQCYHVQYSICKYLPYYDIKPEHRDKDSLPDYDAAHTPAHTAGKPFNKF